jgi:DNA helicase IV
VADDMTPGEVRRSFERIERQQKASDDRLGELARQMVPTELWSAEQRADRERIARQEKDAGDTAALIERTSQERMKVLLGQIAEVRDALAEHKRAHADNSAWSRNKKLIVGVGVLGATATILAAWVAAALAAGGLH